jgi:hypothetical protein
VLDGGSMTWNGGGTLALQIGPDAADALALTGALTKGAAGAFTIDLLDAGITGTPETYTLVTFGSTSFAQANFTLELPQNVTGMLVETKTGLEVENLVEAAPRGEMVAGEIAATSGAGAETEMTQPGGVDLIPTPEPGSAVLVFCGGVVLLGWRSRSAAKPQSKGLL